MYAEMAAEEAEKELVQAEEARDKARIEAQAAKVR